MKKYALKTLALCLAATVLTACGQEQASETKTEPSVTNTSIRPEHMAPYQSRPITDDVMYFVMPDRFNNGDVSNDRGGIEGGVNDHGFDPTHKGMFHGGDLKGLTVKLDYLADMGISAVWLTPIFKNKPTQGNTVNVTAGYHGYWVTDFTQIDPHIGTNDDLKNLVKEAHKRNMKVIFDIITNHTADVIKYEECYPSGQNSLNVPLCEYRGKADYPYTTVGNADGTAINEGFLGDDVGHQTAENFAKLTNNNFAYTPYVPEAEKNVKVPAWLNDIRYYHNRGDSEWKGESSLYGDFAGLDDVFTEHPDVKKGFIDIYKFWVEEFKIDGFRIDTVKHVNDSFWQEFAPAIKKAADGVGVPEFYMFGEVYEFNPEKLSHYTTVSGLPAVLDFGFQGTANAVISESQPTAKLADFYAQDRFYKTEKYDASILPTFLGNHDMGRIGRFIMEKNEGISDEEALKRSKLAHALMFFTRGVPVIYYGDEQGFTGDGHDQDAREDMFESQVASYNDNRNIGSDVSPEVDNFNQDHPLYKTIQEFAALKRAHVALRSGVQTVLKTEDQAGVFAFSREDQPSGEKLIVVLNTAEEQRPFEASADTMCFISGSKPVSKDGVLELAPLSWAVFDAKNCK